MDAPLFGQGFILKCIVVAWFDGYIGSSMTERGHLLASSLLMSASPSLQVLHSMFDQLTFQSLI